MLRIAGLFVMSILVHQAIGKCGYESCTLPRTDLMDDPNNIYVHLIPHTHDDVGWLKTVDQYFYGTKAYYQNAVVQTILDSVIAALGENENRKFTYVEMEFFTKWWYQQSPEIQAKVKGLVDNGQLQFVLAGVSMSDEAVVHYDDSINQLTWGAHFLNETFGQCGHPKVAWQIDPFGHARDQARIFYDSGFDGVFFQRIDYLEKLQRRSKKSLEIMWMTDPGADVHHSNTAKNLFTGIFYDSYCYPQSFCFDTHCQDPVVVNDKTSDEYNADAISQRFINYIRSIRSSFATNHILVPMGCDFTYENAHKNFLSTDRLIEAVNEKFYSKKTNIILHYSTPTCYTKAVNKAFNDLDSIQYRAGDFFPYVSERDRHWTGFYTSRPALKGFIRHGANILRMSEQMILKAITTDTPSDKMSQALDILRTSMGIMQHHDAVTGTEKQHVSNDYAKLLDKAITNNTKKIKYWFYEQEGIQGLVHCPLLNISVCQYDDMGINDIHQKIKVFAYNSLGWKLSHQLFQVPVTLSGIFPHDYKITVTDMRNGQVVEHQKVPIDQRTMEIPERESIHGLTSNQDVFFSPIRPLEPMSMSEFSVEIIKIKNVRNNRETEVNQRKRIVRRDVPVKFRHFTILPSDEMDSGVKLSMQSENESKFNLTIKLMNYIGNPGYSNNSGAYIFSPLDGAQDLGNPTIEHTPGQLFDELKMNFTKFATLTLRVYNTAEVESIWTVGPIPDNSGYTTREVIVRYKIEGPGFETSVKGEFYTDSNGRRMIRRVTGRKLDWNLSPENPQVQFLAGNYFPVVNRIQIRGKGNDPMGFGVYTDRAQGGASLNDGEIELMVHRRCMNDDNFGVGEALKESGSDGRGLIVRGKHFLRILPLAKLLEDDRKVAISYYNTPELFFTSNNSKDSSQDLKINKFTLKNPLPDDIHLLSLSTWPLRNFSEKTGHVQAENKLLIRLESLYEREEEDLITVSLENFFVGIRVISATPMTLNALRTQKEADEERLKWPTSSMLNQENVYLTREINKERNESPVNVIFKKGTIGTFICEFEKA